MRRALLVLPLLAACGRTPGPPDDARLLVDERAGQVALEAPTRFRLVFAADHAWQVSEWNDATSGVVNLAGDPGAFDRSVLQQPVLFKTTTVWSLLDLVRSANIVVNRLDDRSVELITELSWETSEGDLFPGIIVHTISSDGVWRVRATVSNPRPTAANGITLEYADTHVRPQLGWIDTRADDRFSLTLEGSGPRPRIEVTRDTSIDLGGVQQDEAGNLYWGSISVNLDVGSAWTQEWENRVWPPAE